MKQRLLIVFLVLLPLLLRAEPVTPMQARQAAAHFAQQSGLYDTDARMLEDASGLLGIEHIYVFNLAGKRGFVLVAGDDRVQPILGYSFSDYFDARVEGVRSLLEGYSRAIGKAISNNYETTESVRRQWDVLLDDSFEEPLFSSGGAVGPLLTTTWGQTGYYSESCPYDSPTGAHARTGDAAVALAQVLRYWQHAATGMGAHSYTDTTYGVLHADFGATTYQWSLMPDALDWYADWNGRNAVAQLLFHCGVATETQYGPNSSTAAFACNDSNATNCLQNAFWRYFGFRNDIQVLYRDSMTADQWVDTLKYELSHARVVPCCGQNGGEGSRHTFLIDGYDAVDRFHINWGWEGFCNGFYVVDILPYYSTHQAVLAGVEPDQMLHCDSYAYSLPSTGGSVRPVVFPDTSSTLTWTASCVQSWVHLSPDTGNGPADTLTVTVDTNLSPSDRTAVVTVTQGSDAVRINITQYAFSGSADSNIYHDTLVMACYTTREGCPVDTLLPGHEYLIHNPGNDDSYPSPCNSWLKLVSASGDIIIDSVVYDIKQDSDYLHIYDSNVNWWSYSYSLSGQGVQYSLPLLRRQATIHFHADSYLPASGYRIYLHVCDLSNLECRDLSVSFDGLTTALLMWNDTTDANSWTVYYGTSPYNLFNQVTVTEQHCRIPNLNLQHNQYYFRVFNNHDNGLCSGAPAQGGQTCSRLYPIYNIYASNIHPHSAEISWADRTNATVWYVHYWKSGDSIVNIDTCTTTHAYLAPLDNNQWYDYYISNDNVDSTIAQSCGQHSFHTPVCEQDSVDCRDVRIDSITTTSAYVSWTEYGNGTHWLLVVNHNRRYEYDTIQCDSTHCLLTGLIPGDYYQVAVYNNADMDIESGCEYFYGFNAFCDSPSPCIEYTNLNSCMVSTTYGSFSYPFWSSSPIDYGSTDARSRHTVYRGSDSLLTDPRTGGQLRVIPEGDTATVRLGNWLSGSEGESITYAYDVDTSYYDLLTMKYAAVLEDPLHDASTQPRFTFRLKDEHGVDIDANCYSADFIADSTLGWNVNGHVLWKDWTFVGIDLTPLHGRRVYLQLSTYDCGEGSHYGYAYFNFSCGRKQLIADHCGDNVNSLTAPLGFNYAWHDAATDSLISTERTLTIDSAIDCYCHLSFVGANSAYCGFDMHSSSAYRFPNALFGYRLGDTIDCLQQIAFIDSSFVSSTNENPTYTHRKCDDIIWYFGDSTMSRDANPLHNYHWGEYDVMLVSSIDSGECADTMVQHLVVLPPCPVYDTVYVHLCPGDTFQFYDLQITQPDTFTFVDGMFHHIAVVVDGTTYSVINDTIVENQLPYTFNGQTFYDDSDTIAIVLPRANSHGCDSVILYTLSVYRNQLTHLDTVVCPYDVPLVWNGVLFTDDHRDTVLVTTTRGADSVIVMNLHVSRDLKARIHASRQYVNYDTRCDIWLSDRSSGSTARVWYLPDATDTRNLFQYCYPLDNDSIIIQLVAESEIGCYDTTEAVLFFEEPSLFAPNVFTPSQTTNNTFRIHCQRVATLSVDIFDRRGALVYHWDGTEGFWDGKVDGRPMPQATYVWHAVYTTYVNPNERITLTGTVTLIR